MKKKNRKAGDISIRVGDAKAFGGKWRLIWNDILGGTHMVIISKTAADVLRLVHPVEG